MLTRGGTRAVEPPVVPYSPAHCLSFEPSLYIVGVGLAAKSGEEACGGRALDGLPADLLNATGAELRPASSDGRWVLPASGVHLWRVSLAQPGEVVSRLRHVLAGDERARADRFRFDRDRSRYIVGRGALRSLLGGYLGVAPEDVRFRYGAHGKPFVAGAGPWFNLSHSGTVALYAVTTAGEIGLDVELDDADFAQERIAERFFSPTEVLALRSLPPSVQARAFLTCWTRKEAFIKARGDGLSLPLDSFDVSLEPGAPAAILRTAWSDDEPGQWCLKDVSDRDAGYIAALALRAEGLAAGGAWTRDNRKGEYR